MIIFSYQFFLRWLKYKNPQLLKQLLAFYMSKFADLQKIINLLTNEEDKHVITTCMYFEVINTAQCSEVVLPQFTESSRNANSDPRELQQGCVEALPVTRDINWHFC